MAYKRKWTVKRKLQQVFGDMKSRCYNPNTPNYYNYGGRGVRVLWNSPEEFYNDMAPTYKKGLTIDRIDVNGHYCKENCRWITRAEQCSNTRRNVWLECNGEKRTITEWAKILNVSTNAIRGRIERGYSIYDALHKKPLRRKNILYKGKVYTANALARELGISRSSVLKGLKRGFNFENPLWFTVRGSSHKSSK